MFNRVHYMAFPGFWWLVGLACLIVLVVGIAWLIAWAVRSNRQTPPGPSRSWPSTYAGTPPVSPGYAQLPPRPTPHDILRERLARGEIAIDEFQRTLAVLGPDPYAPQPVQAPPPDAPLPPGQPPAA